MIRRPPRSTQSRSSAASDVYKRQIIYYRSSRTIELRSTRRCKRTIDTKEKRKLRQNKGQACSKSQDKPENQKSGVSVLSPVTSHLSRSLLPHPVSPQISPPTEPVPDVETVQHESRANFHVASHIYTMDMFGSSPTTDQCSHNETRASTAFEPNPGDPLWT